MSDSILSAVSDSVFGVWFLIGAALVFFMQCGFAMVESGFTRAKNAGNIIMKNLMDFCIGAVMFILLGFGLMMGEECLGGLIGMPTLGVFTDYAHFDWSNFVFNLVFCATAATIVSGAMAERTKFSAYCIYSAVISAVVYPVEAGWIWNSEGWLAKLGFHDFAGSTAIHMVGGIAAFIGAAMLGPRIGKYKVDKKTGKKIARAIPGHNLTIGALGVFILWFGWYGFNGAAATSIDSLASIFVTTTLAPAVATVVTMIFTWVKDGKPDVSMSLNASLAGLEDSIYFVRESGIDAYAPAIGTAHGVYIGTPTINFNLVAELKTAVEAPVVIHGGTGLSEETFRRLIRNGGAKVNVSTAIKHAYRSSALGHYHRIFYIVEYLHIRLQRYSKIRNLPLPINHF